MPLTTVDQGLLSTNAQYTGFKNRIINGAMMIWQRGTSFAALGTGVYSADRWKTTIAGTSVSVTATQDTSVPSVAFEYSLKYQQITSNATSVTEYATRQAFELANVYDLAGQSVTLSFWYRSNIVGTHGVRILPLGTTGGVDTSVAITVNTANTWEYKTVTTTALSAITSWGATADNGQALIVDIGLRVNGVGQTTVNVNDNFQVTGVQLEKGSTATSFDYRPYGTEMALCERYFQRCGAWNGAANNSTNWLGVVSVRTTMRTTPSISATGPLTISNFYTADPTQSSLSLAILGSDTSTMSICFWMFNFSGLTGGAYYAGSRAPGGIGVGNHIQLIAEL